MSSSDTPAERMIGRILARPEFGRAEVVALLSAGGAEADDTIRRLAYEVKRAHVGPQVYLRGLVEISNVCAKNCLYCGIRRDARTPRYTMSRREILGCVRWIGEAGYGSVVLQAGERSDPRFVAFVESIVASIRRTMGDDFGITLACGEQSFETYLRWRQAGAHRYLLRIETSSESLYRQLHPLDHSFGGRVQCLEDLQDLGYQVGSGVMIGFPGQTIEDLADDLLFLRSIDVDMIGMGPYLAHHGTPLGANATDDDRESRLTLALRMISVARLLMPDVNIAATTALQALHPMGREMGLLAGANVLMPVVTPPEHRRYYVLYDERPCVEESAEECRACVAARIASIGESAALGVRGDPVHFAVR